MDVVVNHRAFFGSTVSWEQNSVKADKRKKQFVRLFPSSTTVCKDQGGKVVLDASFGDNSNTAKFSNVGDNSLANPTISSPLPLPLPPSRSLLPTSLKFLWFSKKREDDLPKRIKDLCSVEPPFQRSENEENALDQTKNCSTIQENALDQSKNCSTIKPESPNSYIEQTIDDRQEDARRKRGWIENLLHFSSFRKDSSSHTSQQPCTQPYVCNDCTKRTLTELGNLQNIVVLGENNPDEAEQKLFESDASESSSCSLQIPQDFNPSAGLSSLEVPYISVVHDRQSFSQYLQAVPLTNLKLMAKMSYLCNRAYRIKDINPDELYKSHGLTYITSSLERKTKSPAKDEANQKLPVTISSFTKNAKDDNQNEAKMRFGLNPNTWTSVPARELHSQTKSLLPLQSHDADQNGSPGNVPLTFSDNGLDNSRHPTDKTFEESLINNCPCEWFCCEHKGKHIRYFVIQGSESLASWQTNLLFEPTNFEDFGLGVLVHRGIYEAAKGLYEQLLPDILEYIQIQGDQGRIQFTGHSLGGSLATLLSLMLQVRGVIDSSSLLPVVTFGSPCIMCGGDYLLEKLGLAECHIQSVVMHRDIVPRTFACEYPQHVVEVLKRLNGTFRDHPCLMRQKLLYAPMGQYYILQPDQEQSPPHPLLPSGSGIHLMKILGSEDKSLSDLDLFEQKVAIRAAQRAFFNAPHPLEILSDPSAYGPDGSISRDHDALSYSKALDSVLRLELKRLRHINREQRRQIWWPLVASKFSPKEARSSDATIFHHCLIKDQRDPNASEHEEDAVVN